MMDPSSLLSAIQQLSGSTPKEKFKKLHDIASEMNFDIDEFEELLSNGKTQRVQPGLVPYLQILVGERIKSNDAVISALKSDDITIIRQALNSKFFFNSNNSVLNPDYFVSSILPYISVRTRHELIKTLARRLAKHPQLADTFFFKFSDVLGFNQVLPLITACSEKYIDESIFNHKDVILPNRMLRILYRKYPKLIIHQFQSKKYWRNNYIRFLPELIKKHPMEFVELYEQVLMSRYDEPTDSSSSIRLSRLGSTRAKSFLKNASEMVVNKPHIYFEIMPLKLVSYKLGAKNFEIMIMNLLPLKFDSRSPSFSKINDFSKYYPKEKKLNFIQKMFNYFYGSSLFGMNTILDKPEFYKLVPESSVKKDIGQKSLASFKNKSDKDDHLCFLPPQESIPKLKEMIKTSAKPRSHWINQMITSCAIYDDKVSLLEVLKYYNIRHKNERLSILESVLETLTWRFDFMSLDKNHLDEIMMIVQRLYVKGDLFSLSPYLFETIIKNLLLYFFQPGNNDVSSEDKKNQDMLVTTILEGYLEYHKHWNFAEHCIKLSNECTVKFLTVIENNYSKDHEVWDKFSNKLNISFQLLQAVQSHQEKNLESKSSSVLWNLGQENLTQLKSFAKELVEMDITSLYRFDKDNLKKFRKLVREYDPASYQSWIDERLDLVNDVESLDALSLLKRDHEKIQDKCVQYLDVCRKSLMFGNKFTRQFVSATKWYENIPTELVMRCVEEIQIEGSILVLGILLEGKKFKNFAKMYLPEDILLNLRDDKVKNTYQSVKNLSKAMNFTNPPVTLDVIIPFCQGDYITPIRQTLVNVGRRTRLNDVFKFVDQLVNKPVGVRKVAFQLIFEVATKNKLQEFLVERWQKDTNRSIRELMVKIILDLFKQTPNEENWQLVVVSIDALTVDDVAIIEQMIDLRAVNESYLTEYMQRLILKIESFGDKEIDKPKLISSLVKNIDENIKKLPDHLVDDIVQKYLFKLNISFILYQYLSPDCDRFEHRLTKFSEMIDHEVANYNQPDERHPRFYRSKQKLQDFTEKLQDELLKQKYPASLHIVKKILSIFESKYEPCEFPIEYIQLFLLKEFFKLDYVTPRYLGIKCGKKINKMLNCLSSEIFSKDIATFLYKIIICKNYVMPTDTLNLIEGLMESDDYYGSMVGIYLVIKNYDLDSYDSRYDRFLKTWRNHSPIIKALVNKCLKGINDWYGTYHLNIE